MHMKCKINLKLIRKNKTKYISLLPLPWPLHAAPEYAFKPSMPKCDGMR